MAEPARHHVVRPLSRAAARRCARPGCPAPAQSTLSFSYDTRTARVGPLVERPGPEVYDLCRDHADRTTPPHGWELADDRPEEPSSADTPEDLGSDHTVAVLAAALHGDGRDRRTHAVDTPDAEPGVQVDLLGDPAEDDPATADGSASLALEELTALSAMDEPEQGEAEPAPPEPGRTVPAAHRSRD